MIIAYHTACLLSPPDDSRFYLFPFSPVAYERHRFNTQKLTRSGKPLVYDPLGSLKKSILPLVIAQSRMKPLCGAICMHIAFLTPILKSHKNTQEGDWNPKKPDNSNYTKFYEDLLNGYAYQDDAQIVQTFAKKVYSSSPSTHIILHTL